MSIDASYCRMKSLGFDPKNILDVGAFKGRWTHHTRHFFPNASFTMIEANDHPELVGAIKAVLSDSVKEVSWYSNGGTGDSIMKERTSYFTNVTPSYRESTTLDILFPTQTFDFIKIDCQGAEIDIMKGGERVLQSCSAILLECPFAAQYNSGCPSFAEYIAYLDQIGFTPFEMPELHCIANVCIQIDIIFVRKTHPLISAAQSVIGQMGS